jgi:16S rRNA (guanine966-N2)-methyltransferase
LGAAPDPFDLVFLDPPYRSGLAAPALAGLGDGWLAPGARIVVELAAKETLVLPDGLTAEQERRYGAAKFLFLRSNEPGG